MLQVTWEVVRGLDTRSRNSAPESAVYVGIQQMEYGNLARPYLHTIGPYSGQRIAGPCRSNLQCEADK